MKITELASEGLKRKIEVQIASEKVQTHQDQKILERGKTYKVPGFRPGKVPLETLREVFAAQALQDAISEVVQETASEVLKGLAEKGLIPALKPEYSVISYDEEKGLVYTLSFEVTPDVPEVVAEGFALKRALISVSDEEIETFIKELAEGTQETQDPETPRPAALGDRVKVTLTCSSKGKVKVDLKEVSFDLDAERTAPEFLDLCVGMSVGETKKKTVSFSKDLRDKRIAGKNFDCDCTLHQVQESIPAQVNDALATQFGHESLEAFRGDVKVILQKERDGLSFLWLKRQILDALSAKYPFEVPSRMVDVEYKNIWEQTYRELDIDQAIPEDEALKTVRSEAFKNAMGKTEEELVEFYKTVAERRVRLGFSVSSFAKKHEISLTEEESKNALWSEMRNYPGQENEFLKFALGNQDVMARIQAPAFENKVLTFIAEKNPSDPVPMSMEAVQAEVEKLDF